MSVVPGENVSPRLPALSTANFAVEANRHDATGELGQPQEAQGAQVVSEHRLLVWSGP
jgi:hypothetical protein